MSDLDPTSVLDYHDVLTLNVPPNMLRKSKQRRRRIRNILIFLLLIIVAVIIPITVIFTKNTDTNFNTTDVSTIQSTMTTRRPLQNIHNNANIKWIQKGNTVVGNEQYGSMLNQLFYPENLYYDDDDQMIYIADTGNHRIVRWKDGDKNGEIVAGGHGKGNHSDQLNNPTNIVIDKETNSLIICDSGNKRIIQWFLENVTNGQVIISNILCYGLAMDDEGYLYISDYLRHEVTRWKIGNTSGIVVAGGNGKGNRSDQLDSPRNIFIDRNRYLYVSEEKNYRITKWTNASVEGIIVAGGQDVGNNLRPLLSPRGLAVDFFNTIYVVDTLNNRVMRWFEEGVHSDVIIGENDKTNEFDEPIGLSFDGQGNLYISDRKKHRVQRFDVNLNATS